MLLVAVAVGLFLLLLKEIGAFPIDHVWTVLILVFCLVVALLAGFSGGGWPSFRRHN